MWWDVGEGQCSCYLQGGGIVLMVAALILLGEGLRLGLIKISDMCAVQHVQHSALPPFICIHVQQVLKLLQFS